MTTFSSKAQQNNISPTQQEVVENPSKNVASRTGEDLGEKEPNWLDGGRKRRCACET